MSPARRPRGVVFTDRDGTLNREVGYVSSRDQLRLLPGAAEGVRRLRAAGFAVVVVSNQSGVARGLTSCEGVAVVHDELRHRFAARGAALDAIYFCPHHPEKGDPPFRRACRCRKPAPGLARRALRELGLELGRGYVVGDTVRDLGLAAAIGVPGILVLTGHGRATRRELDGAVAVAHVAANFRAAAEWIIADAQQRRRGPRPRAARTSRRRR
jgi:histidinol-phosphate phosphatase family protein